MTTTGSIPNPMTLGGLLACRARRTGARPSIISGSVHMTFDALEARVARAATLLRRSGVGRGDRVALLLRNGAAYCELFLSIARVGAICCPVNHRLSPVEIARNLGDCKPRLVVYDPEFHKQIALYQEETDDCLCFMPINDDSGVSYETLLSSCPPEPLAGDVLPGDPVLIVYTSGTTGRAKGAVITHEQLIWASFTISQTVDTRFGDMHLLVAPMFHVGGLSFMVHCIHNNATLVPVPSWNAARVLELIETFGINHFFAVPTMLKDLADHFGNQADEMRSLRWIMSGAAPLSDALVRRYAEVGIPLLQSYGATETCGPALCVDAEHVNAKGRTIGMPFFHTQMRLVADDGNDATPGQSGEIYLRAPHIFSGYWENRSATEAAFEDGWFRSGDVAYRDQEGFVHLVDRKNDLIISGGENVYPREVEAALEGCPGVLEVAVVGLPDPKWGEIVCAAIVPVVGTRPTRESVVAYCAGRLARYKVPARVVLQDELPKNAIGKVQREVLRTRVIENMASSDGTGGV
jgi:fatty-acyl-CoA synthase